MTFRSFQPRHNAVNRPSLRFGNISHPSSTYGCARVLKVTTGFSGCVDRINLRYRVTLQFPVNIRNTVQMRQGPKPFPSLSDPSLASQLLRFYSFLLRRNGFIVCSRISSFGNRTQMEPAGESARNGENQIRSTVEHRRRPHLSLEFPDTVPSFARTRYRSGVNYTQERR